MIRIIRKNGEVIESFKSQETSNIISGPPNPKKRYPKKRPALLCLLKSTFRPVLKISVSHVIWLEKKNNNKFRILAQEMEVFKKCQGQGIQRIDRNKFSTNQLLLVIEVLE